MKKFYILILAFIAMATAPDFAAKADESPAQLKTLYSSYKQAMQSGNYDQARVLAEDAWNAAESTMGEAKQTGDLAYNYAVLGKTFSGSKRNKTVEKAFGRSLELSRLHGEKSDVISLRRYVDFAGYWLQLEKRKKAEALLITAETLAKSKGLIDSKAYAEHQYLVSDLAYKRKKYVDAKTAAVQALAVFEKLGMTDTKSGYKTLYTLARAQVYLEEWPEAMLGFEKIFTNMDGVLPPKNPLIGRAFLYHHDAKASLWRHDEAEYQQFKERSHCWGCWPKFDSKYLPLLNKYDSLTWDRNAPVMPRKANSSAFVVVKYDLDAQGIPVNLKIIQASHARTFDQAAGRAIKTWRAKTKDGEPARNMTGLVTQLTFLLTDSSGNMLDFYGLRLE